MKQLTFIAILAFAANSGMVLAQTATHAGEHEHVMVAAAQPRYHGEGVIKAMKADKVQIAHEPIDALQWPAMTMWFGLQTSLPAGLHAGDKVRFELVQGTSRQWVLVSIERM